MSNVAYIATKDVRHLASWTQDRKSTDDTYQTGGYRPICGGKLREWQFTIWPNFPYEDQKKVERAQRKPVCRRCLTTLFALNQIAGPS